MNVDIYRSNKREGLYLFIKKDDSINDIPEALSKSLGILEHVMTILISEDKPLARAAPQDVIQSIVDNGFYIQMPPAHPGVTSR